MDVRKYFRKIKELQAELGPADVIVCSLDTHDGGRAGVLTEVSPRVAGELIVNQRARLATPEETAGYRKAQADALHQAEEAKAAQRIQVHLLAAEPGSKKK